MMSVARILRLGLPVRMPPAPRFLTQSVDMWSVAGPVLTEGIESLDFEGFDRKLIYEIETAFRGQLLNGGATQAGWYAYRKRHEHDVSSYGKITAASERSAAVGAILLDSAVAAGILGALAIALNIAGVWAKPFWITNWGWIVVALWVGGIMLALVSVLLERTRLERLGSTARSLDVDDSTRLTEVTRELRLLSRESITRVVNRELGPQGILQFPAQAPTLVELDTRKVVSSSTIQTIVRFIEAHESSAIGLSGARGSGKSTIMSYLKARTEPPALAIFLTAPVDYEAADFLRRLLVDLATQVLRQGSSRPNSAQRAWHRAHRVFRARLAFSLGLFVVGAVLTILSLTGLPSITSRLSAPLFASLIILLLGIAATLYSMVSRMPMAEPDADHDDAVSMAHEVIDSQRHQLSLAQKSKNTFALFGKLVSGEDEDSITRTRTASTVPDLIADFRRLSRAYLAPRPGCRILLLIDELDKLSSVDSLVNAVNNLKDTFHMQGVHVVVSVSTDALRSFQQRGLPTRDAFDSSFDTVVEVAPLEYRESNEVLQSRAEGFPPLASAFCHAWSGGLPRELVRTARNLVDLQRQARPEVLPLAALAERFVTEELTTVLESMIRVSAADEYSSDRLDALWDLRLRLRQGGIRAAGLVPEWGAVDSSPNKLDDSLIPVYQMASIGVELAALMRRRLLHASEWATVDAEFEQVVNVIAAASRSRSDEARLRTEAFADAIAQVRRLHGPSPI